MDEQKFNEIVGKMLDAACHWAGSGFRQFSEYERAAFLKELCAFFNQHGALDFESMKFMTVLQKTKKYESVQDQASAIKALLAQG